MSKRKRRATRSRDAPQKRENAAGMIYLTSPEAYRFFCGDGYRPITSCPEVQMCIAAYADAIANMTLHLMLNTEKGDTRVINGLSRKLDIDPNRHMTHQTFFENIVRVMMSEGNQVTAPVYDGEFLAELVPLPPSQVTIVDTQDGYEIRSGERLMRPDEVLHFPLNPDPERPHVGTGYTVALRDVVKSIRQTNRTKTALLENPKPSMIVKVEGGTDKLQTPEGRREMSRQYIGETEDGAPWFINAEAMSVETVKPLTLSDLAIRDGLELDKRAIAAIMGVPAFMVGVGEFNAKEYNWFISTKVMRVARIIQQEMTRKLLLSPEMYFRFNPRSLMSYDVAEIVSAGKEMVDRMAMRRNEWRDWLGMTPDAEMEELFALENYIPIDMLGDQKKLVQKAEGGET